MEWMYTVLFDNMLVRFFHIKLCNYCYHIICGVENSIMILLGQLPLQTMVMHDCVQHKASHNNFGKANQS